MSNLPPKPKGPLLLRRVLFTSALGAGCGSAGPVSQPPQPPPPQPPQPYYDVEREDQVQPADAGIAQPIDPPQVRTQDVEYANPPPPQVEQAPQIARPPQVAPPPNKKP